MIVRKVSILYCILFCALPVFEAVAAEDVTIESVRIARVPQRTRVVLDLTDPVTPVISELDDPQRLVLEL